MKLCDYGCGKEAKHQFKNGKWCCNETINKCENKRKKVSFAKKGKKDSEETKLKKSISRKGKNNPNYGKISSERLTIKKIKNKYPFFCKIENIKQGNKKHIVLVQCKFCKNWFTPTTDQLRYRIYALERENGNDGLFFYCSTDCKKQCPSYNIKPTRLNTFDSNYIYTQQQYTIFKKYVLKRDKYICQYCGEKAEHVHHERPQKLEPFHALDPDLAWSVCSKCHYEKGHPTGSECSNRKIGLKVCNNG